MTFRRLTVLCLTVLCWIFLFFLPPATAFAADTLDLWVSALTIVPLGDDQYMVNPTISMVATELGNDYDFDVKIEVATEYEIEEVHIDGDSDPLTSSNGCLNCGMDCPVCNDECPDTQWDIGRCVPVLVKHVHRGNP